MNHRVRTRAKFFFEGDHKFFLKGVTYGPFAPDAGGYHFGTPEKARVDFSLMREAGINVVRVYYVPPEWFLDLCHAFGLRAMMTLWWGQNVDFLKVRKAARKISNKVDAEVRRMPVTPASSVTSSAMKSPARWSAGTARGRSPSSSRI